MCGSKFVSFEKILHGQISAVYGKNSSISGTPTQFLNSIKVNMYSYAKCTNSAESEFNGYDVEESIEFCAGSLDGKFSVIKYQGFSTNLATILSTMLSIILVYNFCLQIWL